MIKIDKRFRLPNNQHYPVAQKKDMIVLHHTSGFSAESCIRWWNQTPQQIGTAYVIERDGTIFEAFDANRWAYHIGASVLELEKRSIGIELVSPGVLTQRGQDYYLGSSSIRCPKDLYLGPLDMPLWRGYEFYVPYTADQLNSLMLLLDHLAKRFSINLTKPSSFFELDSELNLGTYRPNFKKENNAGLWSHANFRKDKTDVVPDLALLNLLRTQYSTQSVPSHARQRTRRKEGV